MIICDKCKQPTPSKELINNGTSEELVRAVEFCVDRNVTRNGKTMYRTHHIVVDLCASCQEEILKEILGKVPWLD